MGENRATQRKCGSASGESFQKGRIEVEEATAIMK